MRNMFRCGLVVVSVLLVTAALAGVARAELFYFSGPIDGTQENPPNGSTATGTGYIHVDTQANTLEFHITYSGLVASETAAHIHGPAAPGVNAGVLFGLPAGSPKKGTWNYPEEREADILAGLTYINIHSSTFPGGEIRGQIRPLVPVGSRVPALPPWGLVALSVLLFGAGGLFVVRRRPIA